MAKKLLNLYGEDGANIIDDDTVATLGLENTSTGTALDANNSGGNAPALVARIAVGNPTVAPLRLLTSTASGPALELQGRAFISALSGGSITGGIRVKVGDTYYWIPTMVGMGGLGS